MGLKVCVRDDDILMTLIVIVFKGASWSSPNYHPMLVMIMQSTFVHLALHRSCPHVSRTLLRNTTSPTHTCPSQLGPSTLIPASQHTVGSKTVAMFGSFGAVAK